MNKKDKRFKQYVGTKGEDAAAGLLRDKGYNILRRNYSVHNVIILNIKTHPPKIPSKIRT